MGRGSDDENAQRRNANDKGDDEKDDAIDDEEAFLGYGNGNRNLTISWRGGTVDAYAAKGMALRFYICHLPTGATPKLPPCSSNFNCTSLSMDAERDAEMGDHGGAYERPFVWRYSGAQGDSGSVVVNERKFWTKYWRKEEEEEEDRPDFVYKPRSPSPSPTDYSVDDYLTFPATGWLGWWPNTHLHICIEDHLNGCGVHAYSAESFTVTEPAPTPAPTNVPTTSPRPSSLPSSTPSALPTPTPSMGPTLVPTLAPSPACEPGQGFLDGDSGTCESCPAGKFSYRSEPPWVCSACEPGFFQAAAEQSHCNDACGPGTYSTGGASACESCEAGRASNSSAASTCRSCAAGKYQPFQERIDCISCPVGSVASASRISCENCNAGEYVSNSTYCLACPLGKYNPVPQEDVCEKCKLGSVTKKRERATSCTSCEVSSTQKACNLSIMAIHAPVALLYTRRCDAHLKRHCS